MQFPLHSRCPYVSWDIFDFIHFVPVLICCNFFCLAGNSPADFFALLLDNNLLANIVRETNAYAAKDCCPQQALNFLEFQADRRRIQSFPWFILPHLFIGLLEKEFPFQYTIIPCKNGPGQIFVDPEISPEILVRQKRNQTIDSTK